MIARPGCISRFRCFLPSPFVKQKRFGVSALAPTPSLGFAHSGSAPASVRGAERCPQAPSERPWLDPEFGWIKALPCAWVLEETSQLLKLPADSF